jgi:transcriptional regulator with XRE-family HTH domain
MSNMDLNAALQRKGMTGRDLARATGIEEATVSRYRNGLTPTDDNARRIAAVLSPPTDGARTPVELQEVAS